MKSKIENITIGNYNFHIYSIETDDGFVRGIEITDAYLGIEEIGFRKKLMIPFTDTNLIDDPKSKRDNVDNIENLEKLSKLILELIKQKQ